MSSKKKKKIFLCIYKMYLMSAEGYKNAKSDFLPKTGKIWGVSIRDIGNGLGVTNISDLV